MFVVRALLKGVCTEPIELEFAPTIMKRILSTLILVTAFAASVGGAGGREQNAVVDVRERICRAQCEDPDKVIDFHGTDLPALGLSSDPLTIVPVDSRGLHWSNEGVVSPFGETRGIAGLRAGFAPAEMNPVDTSTRSRSPLTLIAISGIAGMICRFIKK